MEYRGAQSEDLAELLPLAEAFALERAQVEGRTLAEDFREYLEPGMAQALASPAAFVVVAVAAERIAGYAIAHLQEPPPILADTPHLFISDLYVAPEHRRAGVGTALLQRARGWGLVRGITRVSMVVPLVQQPALHAAAKAGFRPLEQLLVWDA